MDGISGATAMIALGGFVATTIQRVNELIHDVRKASKEMLGLIRYLQLLKNSSTCVEDSVRQSHSTSDRNGSLDRITDTVEYYIEILNSIEVLIDIDEGTRPPRNRLHKAIDSAKIC